MEKVLAVVGALLSLLCLDLPYAVIALFALMCFVVVMTPSEKRRRIVCWLGVAFVVGMVSDYLMNVVCHYMVTQRENTGWSVNWFNMVEYFDRVGTPLSMMFAGTLTALMTLNVLVFFDPYQCTTACIGKLIFVGFVVGAAWGVWVESLRAKAAEPLMVFYDNTKGGYIENRLWDGATIAFASVITWTLCRSI